MNVIELQKDDFDAVHPYIKRLLKVSPDKGYYEEHGDGPVTMCVNDFLNLVRNGEKYGVGPETAKERQFIRTLLHYCLKPPYYHFSGRDFTLLFVKKKGFLYRCKAATKLPFCFDDGDDDTQYCNLDSLVEFIAAGKAKGVLPRTPLEVDFVADVARLAVLQIADDI